MDFSPLNFVDSCQITASSTTTTVYCYSSATALNEFMFVIAIFLAISVFAYKVVQRKK